ncbi:hypothetical protein SDC9_134320 [bioreactor metagenome]|uniref:Uncharacterized protein n=1 Tax=bioreactor metagenome TaxID=1076179 RepID=A0A645DCY1_9ZZZZ
MHHEFTDPFFVGGADDIDVACLAGNNRPELIANALEFAVEGNSHRIGEPGLAIGALDMPDGTEVVFAAANGQALIVLTGQQRLGNGVAIGNRHPVHGLAVLVLQQGRQPIDLVVANRQKSRFASRQVAKGLEYPIVSIEHLMAEPDRRQIDIAGPGQSNAGLRLCSGILEEELRFGIATDLDRAVKRIEATGHQPGLVFEIALGHRNGGTVRPILDNQRQCRKNNDQRGDRRHDQLLCNRASCETGRHVTRASLVVIFV